jgi:hypothetical protein
MLQTDQDRGLRGCMADCPVSSGCSPLLRCDDRGARHLRRAFLPPHARSRGTGRSRSVDLRRRHGRGGPRRARVRLAVRQHQRPGAGGVAAPRHSGTRPGVRRLPSDRHHWCAALGAAGGVLDSTVKALVADLVPASRRATAYGVFAAVQGAAAIAGGVMAGALYERSLPILIAAVAASQAVALILLIATLRRHQRIRTEAAANAP